MAIAEDVLDLGIGLAAPETLIEGNDRRLGDRQAELDGERRRKRLGDKRFLPLSSATELDDEKLAGFRLDDRRQRASLAERRRVSNSFEVAHLTPSASGPGWTEFQTGMIPVSRRKTGWSVR
ncbi:MAG: hypothetical protein R3A46_20845 [Thermomicrobiales bacterium]